MNETILIY